MSKSLVPSDLLGLFDSRRGLILCFGGFMAWFLAVPLFGSRLAALAAARAINPLTTITSSLLGCSLAFLTAYFYPALVPLPKKGGPSTILLAVTSLLYGVLPGFLWPLIGLIQGLIAVPLALAWTSAFALGVTPQERGRVMGLTICTTNLVLFLVIIVSRLLPPHLAIIVTTLPLLLPLIFLAPQPAVAAAPRQDQTSPKFLLYLLSTVLACYFLGG